jgi:4-amino-4-deoxy-L-arabinose transferase-like glycosyltransferase
MMTKYKDQLLIILFGVIFFIPFLGGVHLFDWDEINFAEIAREMIVTGDYFQVQINYQPFWEKPPLFFWMQAISMQIFGINEFAARLPNAITGIITLLIIYNIGKKIFNQRFGMLWALAYFGSILPHLYFRSGIIDPVFNLFIFLGIYFLVLFKWRKDSEEGFQFTKSKTYYLVLGGFFIGLAILTKGPVGYLIPFLVVLVYWIIKKFKFFISIPQFILYSLIALAVILFWFGIEIMQHGTWFLEEFITYQIRLMQTEDAGHGGFPGYHFIVMLVGCFPASIFAIRGFYNIKLEKSFQLDFRKWMIILFWVVLILFSIVQSKIVHYSSMAYFPLTFLAAIVMDKIISGEIEITRWMRLGILFIAFIFGSMLMMAPYIGNNIEIIKSLVQNDPFTLANLDAEVNWTGWEIIPGIILIVISILSMIYFSRDQFILAFRTLFIGTAVFMFFGLIFFIGRAEMYSQNANIEFCKRLQKEECYVMTSGFKSYTQYFYTQLKPSDHPKAADKEWYIYGDIDRDVYIISKPGDVEYWRGKEEVKEIGSKNGFTFFKREKSKSNYNFKIKNGD